MRLYRLIIIVISGALLLSGCRETTLMDTALEMAGDNRRQLEMVLDHYRSDSLKLAAASFLIENMPYHSGWEHEDTLRLHAYYHALQGSNIPAEQICDSIRKADGEYDVSKRHQSRDIECIKADFLIDHIDAMFEYGNRVRGVMISLSTPSAITYCHTGCATSH